LQQPDSSYSIIVDNIRKVYPPKDGNAEKVAVKGFSLAIQRGQCFGLLGANGAGKTSLISMVCKHILYSKFLDLFIVLER
jgi:ABC-type multidrug transport system ATPase subunit